MERHTAIEILNHPVIGERYFFPRQGSPTEPIVYEGVGGTKLVGSGSAPHPQAKTLIHFHGNGEIVADYDDGYVDNLTSLGFNVLMMEYRGYGASEGTPELGTMLEDVNCLREQCGLKPEETVLYGRSVGAIFAVEWARLEPNIAGLILESGVADPHQRLVIRLKAEELGVSEEELQQACRECLDHRRKLESFTSPNLVMHAADDNLITPEHAELHMSCGKGDNKELVMFERGGHNMILAANWTAYLKTLETFVKNL